MLVCKSTKSIAKLTPHTIVSHRIESSECRLDTATRIGIETERKKNRLQKERKIEQSNASALADPHFDRVVCDRDLLFEFYSIGLLAWVFTITSQVACNMSLWSCGGGPMKAMKRRKTKWTSHSYWMGIKWNRTNRNFLKRKWQSNEKKEKN